MKGVKCRCSGVFRQRWIPNRATISAKSNGIVGDPGKRENRSTCWWKNSIANWILGATKDHGVYKDEIMKELRIRVSL